MKLRALLLIICIIGSQAAFSARISIERNLSYLSDTAAGKDNLLDIYYPKDTAIAKDVLVFIHGGSWDSGKKETYWWLGRNMAHKNVITVIINYSLSPVYQYGKMAADCAEALKWISTNIAAYGGDPKRIYVMGHSAGGHLGALINADTKFFKSLNIENPIHGLILNDAFGLDMFEYLTIAEDNEQTKSFLNTFSNDKETWKAGSPLSYTGNVKNPMLIFVGEQTYEAIQKQSDRLYKELQTSGKQSELKIIPRKKHVGMISQMIFRGNGLYSYILDFMKRY